MNRSNLIMLWVFIPFAIGCYGQQNTGTSNPLRTGKKVGGGCDGCEEMYIGMPEIISSIDTSLGWYDNGQKLMITGKVLKPDGRTPAPHIILYYHQTDETGYYPRREGLDAAVKNHGSIRGWVKTDEQGEYTIYTIRPAPYPDRSTPAHIHVLVKEPHLENEYYIDDFVFDDDPMVIAAKKKRPFENRGGSGILRTLVSDGVQIAEHNIILAMNIPNHPDAVNNVNESGLPIGDASPSFAPFHAWGPDKGKSVCPVCKYGRYHGIIYFVGNNANEADIKSWLTYLEKESEAREKYLKVYFVYGNEKGFNKATRTAELELLGKELNIKNTALTFVPSFSDEETEVNGYKINPSVENTFIIYRHRDIIDKFIDIKPTPENFQRISQTLDKTRSAYFDLVESWKIK